MNKKEKSLRLKREELEKENEEEFMRLEGEEFMRLEEEEVLMRLEEEEMMRVEEAEALELEMEEVDDDNEVMRLQEWQTDEPRNATMGPCLAQRRSVSSLEGRLTTYVSPPNTEAFHASRTQTGLPTRTQDGYHSIMQTGPPCTRAAIQLPVKGQRAANEEAHQKRIMYEPPKIKCRPLSQGLIKPKVPIDQDKGRLHNQTVPGHTRGRILDFGADCYATFKDPACPSYSLAESIPSLSRPLYSLPGSSPTAAGPLYTQAAPSHSRAGPISTEEEPCPSQADPSLYQSLPFLAEGGSLPTQRGPSYTQTGSSHAQNTIELQTNAFKCKHCNRDFSRKPSLIRHIKTLHEGNPTYKCDYCGKHFLRRDCLLKHVRAIHLEIKPKYPCSKCGRMFYSTSGRYRHIRYRCSSPREQPLLGNESVTVDEDVDTYEFGAQVEPDVVEPGPSTGPPEQSSHFHNNNILHTCPSADANTN